MLYTTPYGKKYSEQNVVNGEAYPQDVLDFIAEQTWQRIREKRNQLIAETDWAVLPDSPHDSQYVRDYRQALRDLPQSVGNPDDVVWPDNPIFNNLMGA
mgnify:CR=1 FL=1